MQLIVCDHCGDSSLLVCIIELLCIFTMHVHDVIMPEREESHFLGSICLFCAVLVVLSIELALNCFLVHDKCRFNAGSVG